jgi:hypothetical protein
MENTLLRRCQPALAAEGRIFNGDDDTEDARAERLRNLAPNILPAFNGDRTEARPQHVCCDVDGRPRRASRAEPPKRTKEATMPPLQMICNSGHLPRENQRPKPVQALKPWAAGSSMHTLPPRLFIAALKIKLKPNEDLNEQPGDSFRETAAKRGKRAALTLADANFNDKMSPAVTATAPADPAGHALQTDLRDLADDRHLIKNIEKRGIYIISYIYIFNIYIYIYYIYYIFVYIYNIIYIGRGRGRHGKGRGRGNPAAAPAAAEAGPGRDVLFGMIKSERAVLLEASGQLKESSHRDRLQS